MQYPIIDNFNIFNDTDYESSNFINLDISNNIGYIDTGIQLTDQIFKLEISFILNGIISEEQPLASIWTPQYNYWNLFISSSGRIEFYDNGHNILGTVSLNVLHTVIIEGTVNEYIVKYDDEIINVNRNLFDNPTTLKLFIRGDLQTRTLNYSVKQVNISVNNIQIFNLIPATNTINNGMYNTIDNEFYEIQNSIINDTTFKIKKFTYDNIEHLLKVPLPHYFPHPVIDALQRAAAGDQTSDDIDILEHYITPLGIGGI